LPGAAAAVENFCFDGENEFSTEAVLTGHDEEGRFP